MNTRRDVFQAIADPTRREIIGLLAGKSMKLNDIAAKFNISQPAISQQIKILNECGLVKIKQEGRERHCEVRLEKLSEVTNWVEQYRQYLDTKMDSLDRYLGKLQNKNEPDDNK
jgi:DNA-binding transcriptional ArsR family regulator